MPEVLKKEGEPFQYIPWPSWATGPNGEKAIFNSEAEVPVGWSHHGETKKGKSAPAPAPVASASGEAEKADDNEIDAAGVAWDETLHAATKTKTQAGLWRMKVGVSRPEGQEKPLDL